MTAHKFINEGVGKLSCVVDGHKIELSYNAKQFEVRVDTIELDDIRFTKFWGTSLYKLSFMAKDLKLTDKYSFKLKY